MNNAAIKSVIKRVISVDDIADVVKLADSIWHQHFIPIIGIAQVEYMLDKFHSASAIQEQLESGWHYYMALLDNQPVGYMAVIPDLDNHTMMLSKLYVLQSARRQGVGQSMLEFIEQHCYAESVDFLWLTVNRGNTKPIHWYQKRGFRIVREEKKDIGEGFFMDDYIMEKRLPD